MRRPETSKVFISSFYSRLFKLPLLSSVAAFWFSSLHTKVSSSKCGYKCTADARAVWVCAAVCAWICEGQTVQRCEDQVAVARLQSILPLIPADERYTH